VTIHWNEVVIRSATRNRSYGRAANESESKLPSD